MQVRARLAALSLIVAALAAARAANAASAWSDHEVVAARLIAAPQVASPPGTGEPPRGGAPRELRLGLHLRLAKGWHVYWRHPGDAGLPPEVLLTADVPLGAPRLLFPAPERYELRGGLVANGYGGEVVYPLRVPLPPGGRAPARIAASVDYLACEDECIPFHDELALELGAAGPEEGELLARWEARLPVPAATRPGLAMEASYRGSAAGGELVLAFGGEPVGDVFVAPIDGVVVGNPRWEGGRPAAGAPAGAVVPLEPSTAGAMPARLRVEWVATGVAGGGAGEAVEGVAEVGTAPPSSGASAGASESGSRAGDDTTDRAVADAPRGARGLLELVARGAALALTPGALALLLLAATGPATRGMARWAPAAVAAPALAGLLALAGLAGRAGGVALPLAEPLTLATLALPQLALALALWWSEDRGAAGRARWAPGAAAPLVALPFVPALAGGGAWLSPARLVPLAAGFALPWLIAALLARGAGPGTAPSRRPHPIAARGPLLGFLPAAALPWIAYRLAPALPSARLAAVQLAWLGVALAAFLARAARRRGARIAWWAAAAACAATSVWLAR